LRSANDISTSRCSELLESSLSFLPDGDAAKGHLSVKLSHYSLLNQLLRILHVSADRTVLLTPEVMSPAAKGNQKLTVAEAMMLEFKVGWPNSLILNRKTLTKFQLLSRCLFRCKYIEQQLCNAFLSHQKLQQWDLKKLLSRSHVLRQRLLHFVQSYLHYMTSEVLDRHWRTLDEKWPTARSVDEQLMAVSGFLDTCLKECMLTDVKLVKSFTGLLAVCSLYCEHSVRLLREHPELMQRRKPDSAFKSLAASDQEFVAGIAQMEEVFRECLRAFIESLRGAEFGQHTYQLAERLDFADLGH